MYTGVHGGDIIRLDMRSKGAPLNGVWESVAKMGSSCGGLHDEVNCGRPLGMAFEPGKRGGLVVCDAYYGLIRVDVKTGEKQVLMKHIRDFFQQFFQYRNFQNLQIGIEILAFG